MPVIRQVPENQISVTGVDVEVVAKDQMIRTTLSMKVTNRSGSRSEAVLLLPLPSGASVRSFGFSGPDGGLEAKLLPVEEARTIYAGIVRSMRDPALLEFAGSQLLRSSAFPIEPGKTHEIHLSFEQLVSLTSDRMEWCLPRAQALAGDVPWTVRIKIETDKLGRLGGVFSPSQQMTELQRSEKMVELRLDGRPASGSLQVAWTVSREAENNSAPLTLWTCPEGDGGAFVLLAQSPREAKPIPRDLAIVLDRSGSMSGEKWTQAQRAVVQVLNSLSAEEHFRLILFNEGVDGFGSGSMQAMTANIEAARKWIEGSRPSGGTNLHEALTAASLVRAEDRRLPLIFLITDGIPTIGNTKESAIREIAGKSLARLFAVGVGHDVNAPLLDDLAEGGRGLVRHLPPGRDIELAVADLAKAIGHPVLSEIDLSADLGRVLDMQPRRPRDAFANEQQILCGRWIGKDPFTLRLNGKLAGGKNLERSVRIDPAQADPLATWVPRLWAQRRIGELVLLARRLGADGNSDPSRLAELTRDIVKLSTQYGIMTEYTGFLATEADRMPAPVISGVPSESVLRRAKEELSAKAVSPRSGAAAQDASIINTLRNESRQVEEGAAVPMKDGKRLRIAAVQQIANSSLWNRNGRWIESGAEGEPSVTIAFGSAEHLALAERLAKTGRQALLANIGETQVRDEGRIVLVSAASP